MRLQTIAIAGVAMLGLCACHSPVVKLDTPTLPTGNVAYRTIEAAGTAHFELTAGQQSEGAEPLTHAPPVYPAAMIPLHSPTVEVHAKLVIDTDGAVTETRDLDGSRDAQHEAFFEAVRAATATWRFTPMTIIDTVAGKNGATVEKGRHNEPFSLDYAFSFSLRDGVPSVSGDRAMR